jgi:hypothetical protein
VPTNGVSAQKSTTMAPTVPVVAGLNDTKYDAPEAEAVELLIFIVREVTCSADAFPHISEGIATPASTAKANAAYSGLRNTCFIFFIFFSCDELFVLVVLPEIYHANGCYAIVF